MDPMIFDIAATTTVNTAMLYIDPTAITTSIVSASGIIIALGASAGVFLSFAAVAGATVSATLAKIGKKIYNLFSVVENEGKEIEGDITVIRKIKK